MKDDRARLRRVKLIERLRAKEHREAAMQAWQAETIRQKLETLSERTRSLAQLYALRDHATDGADLRGASLLGAHLRELGRTAEKQADEARHTANARLADLAVADRRLQRAESDRKDVHRAILDRLGKPETVPVRRTGTHLE